jgi:hypothetical protein
MPLVMLKSDARSRLKPCLRCGYSLRNNIDARNCPECGLAIRISLRGDDTLEMSNPQWVRAMSRATAVAALAPVGILMALGRVQWNFFRGGMDAGVRDFARIGLIAGASLLALCVAAGLLAMPERRYPDRLRSRKRGLLIFASATLVTIGVEFARMMNVPGMPALPMFLQSTLAVIMALIVWSVLYELARRLPSRRCMRLIRLLAFALAIGFVWMMMSALGFFVVFLMQADPWGSLSLPWTIGSLIYVPAAAVLLLYLSRQFRAAARQADRNWVTDP